jgi:DNA-binding transcriptional MerR regulator/effector-binding domain-containing protein
MKNGLLSVKQMATLRGTTAETLRHYDRIGLFKSDSVDPFTGYRYYSISQYERLGTILELRELGVSLSEIKEYFSKRQLDKSIQLLNKHYQLLSEELVKKEAMKTILGNKLKTLKSIMDKARLNTVIEENITGRRVITYGNPIADRLQLGGEITRLEQNLTEVAPILASDKICCFTTHYDLASGEDFAPVPAIMLDKLTKADKQNKREGAMIKKLYSGRYVTAYHNSRFGEYNEILKKIGEYIREHGYKIVSPIVQIYKIDVTLTDNFSETVIKTEVPVDRI